MNVNYDKFRKWLEESEHREGRCAEEWEKVYPGCQQSVYRNGMWYAFREAGQALARFVIDPENLITSLENENRELRKDKERLDWIEENANDTKGLLVAGICYWSVTKGKERLSEGDDLRDAIDEAIDKSLTKAEGK